MRQVFYYKMRQFYYKMRLITNCNSFITKCDSYYKMGRLLQIATVQSYNLLPSASKQFRPLCCGQHNIFIDFLGELGNINT